MVAKLFFLLLGNPWDNWATYDQKVFNVGFK